MKELKLWLEAAAKIRGTCENAADFELLIEGQWRRFIAMQRDADFEAVLYHGTLAPCTPAAIPGNESRAGRAATQVY